MGRMTTKFGFASTSDDVIKGVSLSGKRAIVTGGTSGIGTETARVLARAGAEVTIAVRNETIGQEVAREIRESAGNSKVTAAQLDLADLKSVRAFAEWWQGPLHILVNNAGIMALPELQRTPEGWEMQFATNFLGHFALATELHGALAAANGARIVSVSSTANLMSPVVFEDLHFRFRSYDPFSAYAQSKTANVLFAVEATRRWAKDKIYVNALNPGAIATNLQKHTGGLKTAPERRKTVAQGAATSVLLAASPELEGIGGRYFEDCNEAEVVSARPPGFGAGVAPYALDPAAARRLWELSTDLVGWTGPSPNGYRELWPALTPTDV